MDTSQTVAAGDLDEHAIGSRFSVDRGGERFYGRIATIRAGRKTVVILPEVGSELTVRKSEPVTLADLPKSSRVHATADDLKE